MKYLITFLITFFSLSIKAQEIFNPYKESLEDYIISYLDDNPKKEIIKVYLLENEITDSLIRTFNYKSNTISIIAVGDKELRKGYIKSVLKVMPLQMIDKKLVIDIIHFGVEIKRKKIDMINSLSGASYNLEYSCSEEKYFIKK